MEGGRRAKPGGSFFSKGPHCIRGFAWVLGGVVEGSPGWRHWELRRSVLKPMSCFCIFSFGNNFRCTGSCKESTEWSLPGFPQWLQFAEFKDDIKRDQWHLTSRPPSPCLVSSWVFVRPVRHELWLLWQVSFLKCRPVPAAAILSWRCRVSSGPAGQGGLRSFCPQAGRFGICWAVWAQNLQGWGQLY